MCVQTSKSPMLGLKLNSSSCFNWALHLVEHGLEVTKHLRHPQLIGAALCWGTTRRSGQGHVKVISRSNQLRYLIKTFFYSFKCFFCCGEVFHKAVFDIIIVYIN